MIKPFEVESKDNEITTSHESYISSRSSMEESKFNNTYKDNIKKEKFSFIRLNATTAYVRADMRFLNKSKNLSICVFYIALDKNFGLNFHGY